jgi:ketosteroid isomerase-like protein
VKTLIIAFLLICATPVLASVEKEQRIKDIIAEVEKGWETGDGDMFRKHFLDSNETAYVKSGRKNIGLDDLIKNHVEPEKEALAFLSVDFSDVDVHFEQGFAWVLAATRVKGVVRQSGEMFDKTGHQTFLLRHIGEDWKIIHTHYSSQDFKPSYKQD